MLAFGIHFFIFWYTCPSIFSSFYNHRPRLPLSVKAVHPGWQCLLRMCLRVIPTDHRRFCLFRFAKPVEAWRCCILSSFRVCACVFLQHPPQIQLAPCIMVTVPSCCSTLLRLAYGRFPCLACLLDKKFFLFFSFSFDRHRRSS